jgi:signal transduction histidine kinase
LAATRTTTEDLSERLHLAEEALQRCERLAVASRFAAAIMHEVNNPLESLINLVYLTKRSSHDEPSVSRNMEIAEAQLARLSEIARTTLSFYRDQAEAKDSNLVAIAESALLIHARRASRQNVEIRKHLRGSVTARVLAGEILQVVSNLIVNALDAVPESGGILELRVSTYREKAHISVTDNGKGIGPSMSKCLFRAHHTTKANGNGLGLWLSKSIAEKHNGTITYLRVRHPGKTTFRLTLPLTEAVLKRGTPSLRMPTNGSLE